MLFHIVEKKKRSRPMSPKAQLEQEKRIRREIANSNERRRMQCINAGFQNLRALMPQLTGEKLSKAAILQHTTEYIAKLEDEKQRIKSHNDQLKRLLVEAGHEAEREHERHLPPAQWDSHSPPPKRKKRDTESSDEGISMGDSTSDGGQKDAVSVEEVHRELLETRQQVERERLARIMIEQRNRDLETQLALSHSQSHSQSLSYSQSPHSQSPHSHISPHPINLKVETHLSRTACNNVQEVSAHHDERLTAQLVSPPHISTTTLPLPPLPLPLPRRNLENLVEAIRQIEGDSVLCADNSFLPEERHHVMLNSEESEKESSVSDPEECKESESSGRDSPSPSSSSSASLLGLCARSRLGLSTSSSPPLSVSLSPAPQAAHQGVLSEKYPIASHLLHRPPYNQFYRPGVIVHKS